MHIQYAKADLFTAPQDYILAHCISADFRLGAGIAVKFKQMGVKNELERLYNRNVSYLDIWREDKHGTCLFTEVGRPVYNLVTKERYYHKPTYTSLEQSLWDLRRQHFQKSETLKLAMPKIGCGLDNLRWEQVEDIVIEVFKGTDTEIAVYYL